MREYGVEITYGGRPENDVLITKDPLLRHLERPRTEREWMSSNGRRGGRGQRGMARAVLCALRATAFRCTGHVQIDATEGSFFHGVP